MDSPARSEQEERAVIEAVIFDFDGLIIDTETPSYEAFARIYREYGTELSLEAYAQCIGTSFSAFNPYRHLEERLGRAIEEQSVRRRFRELYASLLEEVDLRPGVEDYLLAANA